MRSTTPRFTPLTINASLRWPIVRQIIAQDPPKTILELGCGMGDFGQRLSHIAEYTAAEPDQTSFEIARERITPHGGRVLHGDQHVVPDGSTFDLVCVFEVIEHIEDDAAQVHEWVRLVEPGGRFMISTPAFQEQYGPFDEAAGHYRRYSPEQIRAMFAAAGLQDIQTYLYGWPVVTGLQYLRNRLVARKRAEFEHKPMQERTHASGRHMKVTDSLAGVAQASTAPLRSLYKLTPNKGTGLVAVGRKPH